MAPFVFANLSTFACPPLLQMQLGEEKERTRTLAAELLGLTGSNRGNAGSFGGMGGESAAGAADSFHSFQSESCLPSPINTAWVGAETSPASRRLSSAGENTFDRMFVTLTPRTLRQRLAGMVEVSASIMGLNSGASGLEQRGRALQRE